ncbi:MAG: Nif3-like dinuclear metal center hexameric protein [Dethiobacteria bacterium]
MLTVKKIISYMEDLAPPGYALQGDPVGLQLGNPEAEINKIIISLDPDREALKAAANYNAEMIITHHPLFFDKLSGVDESLPSGAMVAEAIRNRINIYSAHTNFDIVPGGVTYQLGKSLNLPVEKSSVIEITGREKLLKLVVFVPAGHEDNILEALSEAGAGQIGNYSHCSFQTPGTGTFMPGNDTKPFIGSSGRLERVKEIRLETILLFSDRTAVINALLDAHPYEEVAYDLYPLDLEGPEVGLGLLIELNDPITLDELNKRCHDKLPYCIPRFKVFGKEVFNKVALCGGSGGSMIETAARKGAEVFVSGDFKYHDLKHAEGLGLALIDAGHLSTEMPGVQFLDRYLQGRLKDDGFTAEVIVLSSRQAIWKII